MRRVTPPKAQRSDGVLLYCHAHRDKVGAIKQLLGAGAVSQTFNWDGDFTAGDDWFDHISAFIKSAKRVFVFWCNHAAASPNVRREIDYCLSIGTPVIPVLFDNTPVPADLADLQCVDVRQAIRHR